LKVSFTFKTNYKKKKLSTREVFKFLDFEPNLVNINLSDEQKELENIK
jgi:hypothetical protein